LLLSASLLTACNTVPATRISFNPKTGELNVKSPKNVSIEDLEAGVQNGAPFIKVKRYNSTNSAEVVNAVVAANSAMFQSAADGGKALLKLLEKAP